MKLLLAGALLAVTLTAAPPDFRVYVSVKNGPVAVSRINPQTGQGLAAFTVPYGAQNMALTPDGRQAYVLTPSNAFNVSNVASAVSVYDLHSGTLTRTIPLTSSPWQLYFSPDGTTAYVVASDGPSGNDMFTLHLFAIDTATGAVTTDAPYPALAGPDTVQQDAISPDGKLLYVASATAANAEVAIFSLPSLAPAGSFEVDNSQSVDISGMAITPNGEYLVLATSYTGLFVYSTASNAIVGQATLGYDHVVAVSPDSHSAYTLGSVVDFGSLDLQKLDLSTFQLTDSGVDEQSANNLLVSPDGSTLLAGSTFFDPVTLSVIHPNVNTLSITPYGGFTPNSRTLWVLNSGSSELVVIDPATNEAVKTIAVPSTCCIAPGEGKSLLIGSLGMAIASTELGQVVRSTSGDEDGSAAIVEAGGNAYISTDKQLGAYNLQTLDFSELALPPPFDGYANIVDAIAASPDGKRFYADYSQVGGIGPAPQNDQKRDSVQSCDNGIGSGLLAYDTSTNTEVWCIGLDPNGAIAISPDSSTAYVATVLSITTVDLNTQTIRAVTRFPDDPEFLNFAISPDGTTLYGKDGSTGTVAAIDVATMTVTQRYTIPQGSNGLVITPDGSTLYLPNSAYPQVTAINTATGQTTAIPLFSVSGGGIAVAPI